MCIHCQASYKYNQYFDKSSELESTSSVFHCDFKIFFGTNTRGFISTMSKNEPNKMAHIDTLDMLFTTSNSSYMRYSTIKEYPKYEEYAVLICQV